MRHLLALIVLPISACVVPAQTQTSQASSKTTCTVQAPLTPTEADRSFDRVDYAKSEELFTASLSTPADEAAYAGLIRSELEQGKLDAALTNANKAVAAMPSSAGSHTLLGEALERAGEIAEASAEYRRAVSMDRCAARAHFGAGRLFKMASMHASAEREFNVAHLLAPSDEEITTAWLEGMPASRRAITIRQYLAQPGTESADTASARRRHALEIDASMLETGRTCHVDLPSEKVELDLKPLMVNGVRVRDWGLDARINNRGGTLLELDTSVPGVVLSRTAAAKFGVMPVIKGDETNDSGYMGYADSIKIGKATLQGCPVRVVNDKALVGENSLISPAVFADSNININFASRLLTLSPLPARPADPTAKAGDNDASDRYIAPDMQTWSHVYLADGRILVPTEINKSKPYLFMLDTGAPLTIISPPVAEKVLSLSPDFSLGFRGVSSDIVKIYEKNQGASAEVADIYDASGKLVKVSKPFKAPVFEFARVSRLDGSAFSFDLTPVSRAAHVEVGGLIGFSILQDVFLSIDYRDGLVNLVFDSNYLYRVRNGSLVDAQRWPGN
ncbi:MAG TPA: hypothetical protein VGD64_12105 [Acidisarcina sp.]